MEQLLGELNSLCQKLGEANAQQAKEFDSLRSQIFAADQKERGIPSSPLSGKAIGQTDMGARKFGVADAQQGKEPDSGRSQNLAADEKDHNIQATPLLNATEAEEQADVGSKKLRRSYAQQQTELDFSRSQNFSVDEKEQCIRSMPLFNASKAEEHADMGAKALNFQEMLPPGTLGTPEIVEVSDVRASHSSDSNEHDQVFSPAMTYSTQVFGLRRCYVKSETELDRLNKVEKASATESAEKYSVVRRSMAKQLTTPRIREDKYSKFNELVRNPVSSHVKRNWDMIGCFLLFYDVIVIPLGVFDLPSHPLLVFLEICGLIYWTSDIGMTMTTGYYANDDDEKPVMDFQQIVRNYIFSKLFLFDLTLVIVDWIITVISLYTIDTEANSLSAVALARLVRAGRILRLVKLMRVSKFGGFKDNLRRWFSFKVDREMTLLMLDLGKILSVACLMFHYMVCIYFSVGKMTDSWISRTKSELPEQPFFKKYTITGELMSRRANTVSRASNRDSLTDVELAFDGLTWVVSTGFITWLTSTVTSRMLEVSQRRRERNDKLHYIRNHYLVKHQIDPRVRMQLLKFMDKGYRDYREAQQRTNNEAELLEALPVTLARDFRREAWSPLLKEHPFFRTFDSHQMEDICLTAVSEIFCRKRELVFKQNGICSRMLFAFEGHYAYVMNASLGRGGDTFLFDSSDVKISKGCWLSEPVLWTTSWQHRGSLLAITSGFFCAVTPEALELVLKHHESVLHDIVRYAAAYVVHLNIEAMTRPQFLSDVSKTLMEKALKDVRQFLED